MPVTTDATGAGQAGIDDLVGITDAATRALDRPRSAADPVGVTDAVTATRIMVAEIDDILSASDEAVRLVDADRVAEDAVGVTDSVVALLLLPNIGKPVRHGRVVLPGRGRPPRVRPYAGTVTVIGSED